jgi:S-layer protein
MSLMALSLAACGSDSTTTTTATTTTTTTTTTATTDAAQAFDLTAGFDTMTGGSGADTFTSTKDGNYSLDDTLAGGAGTDTLFLRLEDGADGAVTTTGIEVVDIRTIATGSTLDATNMTGLTSVIHSAGIGALTVNGAAAGVGITIKNQSDTDASTLNFKSGSLVGTADTVNVILNGNTGAHTLTIDDATGEIDTLAITSSVANTAITTLAGDALDATKVTFTNTAAVKTAGAITSKTIDASAATAGVTVVVGTADVAFTGGSGNDSIDMAATLTVADTLVGGAGTDTVILNTAPTALTGARITGFEVVQVGGNGLTFDNDFLSVSSYSVEAVAASVLSDLANNTTITLLGDNSTSVTANIKTNTASDVLNLTFGNTAAATQTLALLEGHLNVDTLNVASGGGGANIITAMDLDVAGMNVTGAQNFTITGLTSNAGATEELEIIDASALTGALNLTLTNADNALTVTGSATAANTVVLSGGDDIYVGGAGADLVTGAAGDDTITLGGGADEVILVAVAAAGEAKDIVKDFTVGTDHIHINFGLLPNDMTAIASGALVTAEYIDVAAGAATTTITGNGPAGIFEFSAAADLLGEGVSGTFDASTATGTQLLAAVVEQLNTDVTVALTDGNPGDQHFVFVMYDESGNAVIVNFSESDIAETAIDAGDHMEFVVLEDVAQGALTFGDIL